MPHNLLTDFPSAVDFLYSSLPVFHRQGPAAYKADIGNISELMAFAGNPHLSGIRFIHVAGTNGKGSVAHLAAAYLQASGYSCGLYTSPHYVDMRERIKVNGILIPEQDFVDILNFFLPAIEEIKPSYFEILCAMAFVWFERARVDFAVIEVGMGGRLDSTNIITPVVSVITNISFDHTQFLGKTLEAIATEKAGIIKPHVPVVIGEFQAETMEVFRHIATEKMAPLISAAGVVNIERKEEGNYEISIQDILPPALFNSALTADYQQKNIRTFSAVVYTLDKWNIVPFKEDYFRDALNKVQLLTAMIGRWQTIQFTPAIIFDSAHNEAGIRELSSQLKKTVYNRLIIIFGTVADKDVAPVLALLPAHAWYIWTNAEIQRALPAAELGAKGREAGLSGEVVAGAVAAYRHALTLAGPDDLILVCGSIFVVADIMAGLKGNSI